MAFDAFLKIDGIEGESQTKGHENEIVVLSFSWGLSQVVADQSNGGIGFGKAQVQDLTVTKAVDKASPTLMLACAKGQHIKKAVLTVRKAGEDQSDFLKITLQDFLISSFIEGGHAGSGGDEVPVESASLNFQKVALSYSAQSSDGSILSPLTAETIIGGGA